jgi:hypothetical protein
MLRARMALDSSSLGEIEFGPFFIEANYDHSSKIEANYDRPKYLEANF